MSTAPTIDHLCADLAAEHEVLDRIVASLPDDAIETPTPAVGWTVRDQVTHLAFFDGVATLAMVDPDAFSVAREDFAADPARAMAEHLERGRGLPAPELLGWWREERGRFLDAARAFDPGGRVPWYGPPMSVTSHVSARLMETWCHGQDVVDAVAARREPTVRLRHVAHIGVRARAFSYVTNGRTPPDGDVRVELEAPDGGLWTWGEPGPNRVSGAALDFCLAVTQRRHRDDTDLRIEGPLAEDWMAIAQAFAGPPGEGRRPGQFPKRS